MSSTPCLTQRYPWCTLCTTGNNVSHSGTTALYLPRLLIQKNERGKSNLHAEEDFQQKIGSMNLDPRLKVGR